MDLSFFPDQNLNQYILTFDDMKKAIVQKLFRYTFI